MEYDNNVSFRFDSDHFNEIVFFSALPRHPALAHWCVEVWLYRAPSIQLPVMVSHGFDPMVIVQSHSHSLQTQKCARDSVWQIRCLDIGTLSHKPKSHLQISKQNHHYHGSLHNWHVFAKYNCWFSKYKVQMPQTHNLHYYLPNQFWWNANLMEFKCGILRTQYQMRFIHHQITHVSLRIFEYFNIQLENWLFKKKRLLRWPTVKIKLMPAISFSISFGIRSAIFKRLKLLSIYNSQMG